MTYCVGMVLDKGLVLMSDTRTNSGVDNISVFRKMFRWPVPGQRVISLLTAGNLATTQAVISKLEERTKAPGERQNSLMDLPTMFQIAVEVGKLLRETRATTNYIAEYYDYFAGAADKLQGSTFATTWP